MKRKEKQKHDDGNRVRTVENTKDRNQKDKTRYDRNTVF